MTIGERLKKIRKEKDLTLDKLAEITGVAKATLSRIENNIVGGNYVTLQRISKALHVSLEEAISKEGAESEAMESRVELAILKTEIKDLTKQMIEICRKARIDISNLIND